jgi:hypothetical protein
MSTADLAARTVGLLNVADASEPKSLSQLAALAVQQIPACSGATAALWQTGELVVMAASHPDLSALVDVQITSGHGPIRDALAHGGTVTCPDTLHEERWQEFAGAAVQAGVRWTVTLAKTIDERTVTLTLYGARPRMPDDSELGAAEQLMRFGGAALGNAAEYGQARRTARQLLESAPSRTLVDEAVQMLTRALGCGADEALDRMKRLSQQSNLKVTEVASRIVGSSDLADLR